MELELIFKIAAIGIIISLLNQFLVKAEKAEYAMFTTIAGIIIAVLMIIPQILELFEAIKELSDY